MAEETNISKAAEEIRNATDEELKKVIEGWYERTRTDGMRIGAKYIAAGVLGAIQKNLRKQNGAKASLRDYQRCIDDISKIIAVQLTPQNDLEETESNEATEEAKNDE